MLDTGLASLDMGKDLNRLKDSVMIVNEIPDSPLLNQMFSKYLDRRMPWLR